MGLGLLRALCVSVVDPCAFSDVSCWFVLSLIPSHVSHACRSFLKNSMRSVLARRFLRNPHRAGHLWLKGICLSPCPLCLCGGSLCVFGCFVLVRSVFNSIPCIPCMPIFLKEFDGIGIARRFLRNPHEAGHRWLNGSWSSPCSPCLRGESLGCPCFRPNSVRNPPPDPLFSSSRQNFLEHPKAFF